MIKEQKHKEEYSVPCTMFLDQASTSGWSIWDNDNELVQSGILDRGDRSVEDHGQELVDFVIKKAEELDITTVFYEEVFIPREGKGNISGVENLYYIKHKITDLRLSQNLQVFGLNNATWKKELSPTGTFKRVKDDKKQILEMVKTYYPDIEFFAEDEVDAVGMGIAVMVNNEGSFLEVSKYNKRLPIFMDISSLDFDGLHSERNMYKRYSEPRRIGGIYEIKLNKRRNVETDFRRVLSHMDVLAFCVIPKDYRYWGMNLILQDKDLDDVTEEIETDYTTKSGIRLSELEDGSYIMYAARKKRL